MVSLFGQPLIIRKIFDALEPSDVYQCRLVCKIWHHEAIKWLEKYPPVDECAIIVGLNGIHDNSIKTGPSKTLDVNRALIKILDPDDEIEGEGDKWMYFKKDESYQKVSKTLIKQVVVNFFEKGRKSAPNFCFLQSNVSCEAVFDRIPFNYLTLWVEELVTDDFPVIPGRDIKGLILNNLNYENETQISVQFKPSIYSCFNAFLVNSYDSRNKIMISDWADPSSPKPDPYDPENPIKSLIFLISSPETNSQYLISEKAYSYLVMMSRFAQYFDIYVTGGVINPRHRISFKNSLDHDLFQESPAISIAFIGKQVQSTVFKYDQDIEMEAFVEGLLRFRSGLNFSTDDLGVFGFIFEENLFETASNCQNDYHERIVETFPCVKFVKIMLKTTGCRVRSECPEATVVHIIRI